MDDKDSVEIKGLTPYATVIFENEPDYQDVSPPVERIAEELTEVRA